MMFEVGQKWVINNDEEIFSENNDFLPSLPRLEQFREDIRAVLRRYRMESGSKHYTKHVIDPLDVGYLNDLSPPQVKVIKYVTRHADKNGKEDLIKARNIIDKMLEYEYGVDVTQL